MSLVMVLLTVFLMASLPLAYLWAKFSDPVWRANFLRKMTKKPYLVVKFVNPDRKTITTKVINPETQTFEVNGKMWVVTKDRIYLENSPSSFIDLNNPDYWKIENEVPVIYVNENDFTPIDLSHNETNIKPEEVAYLLHAWTSNQQRKHSEGEGKTTLFQILMIVLIILGFYYISTILDSIYREIHETNIAVHQALTKQSPHNTTNQTISNVPQ